MKNHGHLYVLPGSTPTDCPECVIWLYYDEEWGIVDVSLISGHDRDYQLSWRGRLKRAWHALQGKPDSTLEFFTKDHCERFVDAVDEAILKAWPEEEGNG